MSYYMTVQSLSVFDDVSLARCASSSASNNFSCSVKSYNCVSILAMILLEFETYPLLCTLQHRLPPALSFRLGTTNDV